MRAKILDSSTICWGDHTANIKPGRLPLHHIVKEAAVPRHQVKRKIGRRLYVVYQVYHSPELLEFSVKNAT